MKLDKIEDLIDFLPAHVVNELAFPFLEVFFELNREFFQLFPQNFNEIYYFRRFYALFLPVPYPRTHKTAVPTITPWGHSPVYWICRPIGCVKMRIF